MQLGSTSLFIVKCEERDELKKQLLIKKEKELGDLENSVYPHCKMRKLVQLWLKGHLIEIMGVTHGFNQPSQQKPGIEMGLNHQKHCQLVLKGIENTRQESRLSDFSDPTGPYSRALCFKKRRECLNRFRDH